MAEHKLLPRSNAEVLSSSQKSRPMWEGRTPRWICQAMMVGACVPVHGGIYRINKVTEPFIPTKSSINQVDLDLVHDDLNIKHSHTEGTTVPSSYASYDEGPKEVNLQPVQTVVKMHTRIPALFSTHHNQLEQQLSLAAEYIYETKEHLIFHHPDYGLLNNVAPGMKIASDGPPTPDLLDEMLSMVWKMPDYFVAHPEAIAAFAAEANKVGLPLANAGVMGSTFLTWRNIPIIPTNKLYLVNSGAKGEGFVDRMPKSKTQVMLMRTGEEKQGVLSLYAAGSEGSGRYPFITVDFMGINDESEASYLMTLYAAMAVLTKGALAVAEVTI